MEKEVVVRMVEEEIEVVNEGRWQRRKGEVVEE